jgi:hypothetical protein
MATVVTAVQSPTGGAVSLIIKLDPSLNPYSAAMTIQRYTGSLSNTPVTIYSGVATLIYIDAGDSLPAYLDFTTPYWYAVTDPSGTVVVGPITPTAQLIVWSNYLDKLLFRLFSAGMSALAVPEGFAKIRVLENMPLTMGSEATDFPFVVMNLDLEQQEEIQIGEAVVNPGLVNLQVIPYIVHRVYSMSVLSLNAKERDFYKDACLSAWLTMQSVLDLIGQNLTMNWQATNTQSAGEGLKIPGFYEAAIMLDLTGQFNVSLQTNYPIISSVAGTVSGYTATPTGGLTVFEW